MKKIIKLLLISIFIGLISGCNNTSSMDNINIYTTTYPIEYVVSRIYKNHSTIKSIYPHGVDIDDYKITDVLLNEYSSTDMFIFNGLSEEKDYLKPMLKQNKKLKIIDVSSDIKFENKKEELWLDPSNLLTIANNVKKGFFEYTNAKYLKDEIEKNYESLKIDLTNLEAKYRKSAKDAVNKNIVVTDDMFLFLKNYGINVISIDKKNEDYDKNVTIVKNLIATSKIKYIYTKDNKDTDISKQLITGNITKLKLNSLSTITDEQRNNYDYLSLMLENLEALKKQLNNM